VIDVGKYSLGLWEFPGGVAKLQERGSFTRADMIGTSLSQVVSVMAAGILLPVPTNAVLNRTPTIVAPVSGGDE
jgi:hypothetical protein